MKSLDIYKLIKETLSENSINNVTSYKTSDQKYPYIYVDINNFQIDNPISPRVSCADIHITIFSKYKGQKQISILTEKIISILESKKCFILKKYNTEIEKDNLTRKSIIFMKSMIRK